MKNTWMISTACAAVLAMTGLAAAQGMNEQGGGKAGGGAAQHQSQPSQSKQGQSGRSGGKQMDRGGQMDRGNSPAGQRAQTGGERRETTGQGAGGQSHQQTGQESGRGGNAGSDNKDNKMQNRGSAGMKNQDEKSGSAMQRDQKSGAANQARDRDQKSGEMKQRDQKSGAAANERGRNEHDRNAAGAGGNERNNARGGNERTTTGSKSSAEVNITNEQRTKIRNVVVNQHKIPHVNKVDFTVKVGVRVPRTVKFYPIPAEIVEIHPAWRSYQVIYVENELVLIDPATYEIMYVVAV